MSAYATADAVRLAVNPDWVAGSPEPDSGAQDASSLSVAQINDAIADASGRVDSYIAGRYQTPVKPSSPTAVPPDPDAYLFPDQQIGYWTRDIAAYLATLTFFRSAPMLATEPVALRYAAAMVGLTSVRDGKAFLNLPPATTGDALDASGGFAGVVDVGFAGVYDAADAGFHREWGSVRPGAFWGGW